jgi:nitroreductase
MRIFTETDNKILDEIIEARRSVRNFTDEIPPKEQIEAIVRAGTLAPYASMSAKDVEPFRHFLILTRGNPLIAKMDALLRKQIQSDLDAFLEEKKTNPILQTYGARVELRWGIFAREGVPCFLDSPCLILIAEWRGARRASMQSIAHVMENMWLKATALHLGFKLVSPMESMTDNKDFCDLLGFPVGQYGFHAATIGYPAASNYENPRISTEVKWL